MERTAPGRALLGLVAAATLLPHPLAAQRGGDAPGVQHVVVATDADDEQVDAALEQIKKTILPISWEPKCDDDERRRDKYLKKWQAVVSGHYIVFTNGPKASCKKYAVTLEKLYKVIQKELPFEDPDHLLVAYIFKDPEDYYRFTVEVTGWPEASARATAGHALPSYYATYYESPRAPTVYHEAAHEIVGACLKVNGVGSWFQEGLAVYFEKQMTNQGLGKCRSDVKRGDYYPLKEFFAIRTLLADRNGNGHRNYDHAGDLLDFLINTDEEPVAGRFGDFLKAACTQGHGLARGPAVSARLVQRVYGLSVEQLEEVWMKHLRIKR